MQIHSVDSDSVGRPCVVSCADLVTSCVWTAVRNIHIWMACAPHGSKQRRKKESQFNNKHNNIEVKRLRILKNNIVMLPHSTVHWHSHILCIHNVCVLYCFILFYFEKKQKKKIYSAQDDTKKDEERKT